MKNRGKKQTKRERQRKWEYRKRGKLINKKKKKRELTKAREERGRFSPD